MRVPLKNLRNCFTIDFCIDQDNDLETCPLSCLVVSFSVTISSVGKSLGIYNLNFTENCFNFVFLLSTLCFCFF